MHFNFTKRHLRGYLYVKLGDHIIPQVKKFKYLVSIIQEDDEINDDVNHRIQVRRCK